MTPYRWAWLWWVIVLLATFFAVLVSDPVTGALYAVMGAIMSGQAALLIVKFDLRRKE